MTDVITIDGPAASGKSTVARRVAKDTGRIYVDSGSLYRGIAWRLLSRGVSTDEPDRIASELSGMDIELFLRGRVVAFTVDGCDPGDEIRSAEVSGAVSAVASVPEVRRKVVDLLRSMVEFGALVVEGRDIGSAVFPESEAKFYLDADPAERARRRHSEGTGEGNKELGAVRESLERRDRVDSSRATDPLMIPENAKVVDTTGLSIDQVVGEIVTAISSV
jgi:cytidylate kinase